MHKFVSVKKGFFLISLTISFIVLSNSVYSSEATQSDWLKRNVTINFNNEPLGRVLEKISQQSGVSILYDDAFAHEKVIGNFKDIKISDAVTRLFKGKN